MNCLVVASRARSSHVAIGTVIFIIIALAALLLGLFVHWLGTLGVSG